MNNEAPMAWESIDARLAKYASLSPDGYDEAIDATGRPRPHWEPLLSLLLELSPGEIATRIERLDRRVREAGIDFDIFAHPERPTQQWRLDLTPIVIAPTEWRWLERALIQRARLLDMILRDIYGNQDLLRQGMLPPELVFADPTYLQACRGLMPKDVALRFLAADLARDNTGQWRVIDSHAETIAGIGFAVANRIAHSHVAGDIFRRANAVRLAQFFQNMQTGLAAHAGRDNARIALLTPGPQHQDYFSHAYLARYLGFLLVEGSDLRIRGNNVYLKTLEGLKQIDLLVRCVDGRLVDALELDPAGLSGPAGLLKANRANPNLVVNPIGSAIIQNRGLAPYLAQIAERRLGESLLLPDAHRHWLGDAAKRDVVLADLDRFVIRAAQEGTGRPGQAALGEEPPRLSHAERERLIRSIHIAGAGLVAEDEFGLSTAPALSSGGLEPRPFAIRFFVARTRDGYEVMPGGLAMSVEPGRTVALSGVDGHTRDVWVLTDDEQRHHTSLWSPMRENARIERSQRVIQSRVADDLFWLGRYHERADWTMRVLRGAYRRIEEDSGALDGLGAAHRCLLAILEAPTPDAAAPSPTETEIEATCRQLIAGAEGSRTLVHTCESLYRCANLARDRLSFEAWHTLSRFRPGDTFIPELANAASSDVLDMIDDGLVSLSAFNGLMHENMTRNFGWRFLDLGRRIERAYNLCESIATLFTESGERDEETNALRLILELADSFITYRSRYRIDPSLPLVLDLLLLDDTNPRALAYQLGAASQHLAAFPGAEHTPPSDDRTVLDRAIVAMRGTDVEALAREDTRTALKALMTEQLELLPLLSDAVGRHYFNLTGDIQHRVHSFGESQQ